MSRAELSLGDLGVLTVRTDRNGGARVRRVVASVWPAPLAAETARRVRPAPLALADDGGADDLDPSQPGLQSSLDETAGDGVFTGVLVLEAKRFHLYRACQIVVRAENDRGLASRPASLHLYLPRAKPRQGAPLRVAEAALRRVLPGLSDGGTSAASRFEAFIRLGAPVPGIGSTWVGPKEFRKVLSQRSPTLLRASATTITEPGVYSLVASSPSGDVYYVSFPVLARDLASAGATESDGDDEDD